MNALVEEHRRVAMGIKGDDALMEQFGLMEFRGLANHPLENGKSAIEPFRMPLYTQDTLLFGAFNGFNGTVWSGGRHPETLSGITHGLMMEGVDENVLRTVKTVDLTVLMKCHAMSHLSTVGILRMLDGG